MKKEKRAARQSSEVRVRPQASSDGPDPVVRPEPQSGVNDTPVGTPPDIEGWLPTLLEALDDAYFFHDADGRVLDTNASAWRSLGYERDHLMALTLPDFQTESSDKRIKDIWKEMSLAETVDFKGLHRRRDGSTFPVAVRVRKFSFGRRLLFLSLVKDISEFDRLQGRLLQAQRLESIGLLAVGLAHDFGNMLTPVLSYSELVSRALGPDDKLQVYLHEIQKAGKRAADLAHRLLSFSRQQTIEPRALDLNEVVVTTTNMLRRLVGEDIELVTVLGRDLNMVTVDSGQLQQVLVNLTVNARDAMPQGGELTIESANVTLDDSTTTGQYVVLTVRDTGVGMTDEVKANLFQQFFTTKEQDKGTGLGLWTCYNIVRQSRGHITVESDLGRGTTFKIFLPAVENSSMESTGSKASRELPRGSETVLLVDDTVAVRESTSQVLREQGYLALEAGNGQEALSLVREHGGEPIHLLLTDVVMPLMGGKELARHLAVTHPETKVLYVSGYPDEEVARHGVFGSETPVMLKPLTPETLTRKVREVLDQA